MTCYVVSCNLSWAGPNGVVRPPLLPCETMTLASAMCSVSGFVFSATKNSVLFFFVQVVLIHPSCHA